MPQNQDSENKTYAAFLAAVVLLLSGVTVAQVERLIDDPLELQAALAFRAGHLNELDEALRSAFADGLRSTSGIPKFTASMSDPVVTDALQSAAALRLRLLNEQQAESIAQVVRNGLAAGRNKHQIALDIVGRMNRYGVREGGVVGLSDVQQRYVAEARRQLTVGDATALRAYLTRERRDRRYDRYVKRKLGEGLAIPNAVVDEMLTRYRSRLLQSRGKVIAQTEVTRSYNAGRQAAWEEAIAAGVVSADSVMKTWVAVMDERTRISHAGLDGTRIPIGELFHSEIGSLMAYPGDVSNGAGPADVVNCRCVLSLSVAT